MEHFFKKLQVQNVISDFRKLISDTNSETSFDKDRNEYISLILGDMARNSEEWDQKSQINIGYISERFYNELKAREPSKGSLDEVFSTCFRFLLEYYLNSPGELIHPFSSAKSFAIHQLENFTDPAKIQLEYALREMPITILKGILNGEDFTTVRELPSIKKHTEELKEKWDQELDLRLERLKKLKASLEEYEHAFNFAGLFKGFLDLGETKKAEYNSSKKLVKYLSIAMPLPIVIETVYFMLRGVNFNTPWDLIKITPAASITLLIIYFFKIALKNHTSIKAQLLQIEIRKTLCQFIQSYVTYSKDLKSKEHNPLDKFEDIIFSNIMTAEEKIPSTFDGIDQLANMVQAFKGTKG